MVNVKVTIKKYLNNRNFSEPRKLIGSSPLAPIVFNLKTHTNCKYFFRYRALALAAIAYETCTPREDLSLVESRVQRVFYTRVRIMFAVFVIKDGGQCRVYYLDLSHYCAVSLWLFLVNRLVLRLLTNHLRLLRYSSFTLKWMWRNYDQSPRVLLRAHVCAVTGYSCPHCLLWSWRHIPFNASFAFNEL